MTELLTYIRAVLVLKKPWHRIFSGDCSTFPTTGQTMTSGGKCTAIRPFSMQKPNSAATFHWHSRVRLGAGRASASLRHSVGSTCAGGDARQGQCFPSHQRHQWIGQETRGKKAGRNEISTANSSLWTHLNPFVGTPRRSLSHKSCKIKG